MKALIEQIKSCNNLTKYEKEKALDGLTCVRTSGIKYKSDAELLSVAFNWEETEEGWKLLNYFLKESTRT